MRSDREQAFALRKRGWSYNLIHKKLGVPRSTLSNWLSEISWSKTIRKDLTRKAFLKVYPQLQAMNRARMLKWEKWREEARQEAEKDFVAFSQDRLFIAGIIIYWGEGDKNPMILYPDLDETLCKKYWSSLIGVSQTFFYKTQVI